MQEIPATETEESPEGKERLVATINESTYAEVIKLVGRRMGELGRKVTVAEVVDELLQDALARQAA